jgi:4-hydroxybenzoate polyprenyltransferase
MGPIGFADRLATRVVSALEDDSIPFSAAALSFVGAVMVRTGVEMFSDTDGLKNATLMRFLHYGLFYVSVVIGIVLVLSAMGRTPIARTAKAVLPSFVVLFVAPIADLLASSGEGTDIGYANPMSWRALLSQYVTFFEPYKGRDSSFGIRLELAIVVVAALLYLRNKKASLPRCLVGGVLVYTVIFLNGTLPFWMRRAYDLLGVRLAGFDERAVIFLSVCLYFEMIVLAFVGSRRYFLEFVKDLRWMRVAHYQLFFFLGAAFAAAGGVAPPDAARFLAVVFVPLGLMPAVLFAIVTNNLADVAIDETSNPRRPLFAAGIDRRTYARTGWLFLMLAFYYACLAGVSGFLSIAFFTGSYFLYSVPPVRFKRVPVLSKLVIALNTLALLCAGFGAAGGDVRELPASLVAFVLVAFTLAVNFIDLKDYEGDKAAGICTLPVLIGMRPAQFLIAGAFIAFYGLAYFAVDLASVIGLPRQANLVLLLGLGSVQAFFLTRTPYKELPVFAVYVGSIAALVGYVALFAPPDLLAQLP